MNCSNENHLPEKRKRNCNSKNVFVESVLECSDSDSMNSDKTELHYTIELNNKLNKALSDLSRAEERIRFLQIDYVNKENKIEQLVLLFEDLKEKNKINLNNYKHEIIVLNKQIKNIFICFTLLILFISIYFCILMSKQIIII